MSQYYLIHQADKCVDCLACEVQCKTQHSLPMGPRLCHIERLPPSTGSDPIGQGYVFMPCFHCD